MNKKTNRMIAITVIIISFIFLVILFFLSESLNTLQNIMLGVSGFAGIIFAALAILIFEL